MEELQIYDIVNSVTAQAIGSANLTVVNEQGLVSLGRTVLDSQTYTDDFINTLVKRIGKTVMSYRQYRNAFSGLMKDKIEWGAIVQKVKIKMPTAEEDESYNLTNGSSVDMYKISKPEAIQKLFITDTPYQFKITIQRAHLQEAFLSAEAMGAFISAVFGEVQNAIELALENLGRTCLANYIAECVGTTREIKLVTLYNSETGSTLNATTAVHNENFLRWAVGKIKSISKKMRAMTNLYTDGSIARHTPLEMQKLFVLDEFETQLETQVEYAAFNRELVSLSGFEEVTHWQSIKAPASVKVGRASDNQEKTVTNVVACLFDREALGVYEKDRFVSTTPFNSAGLYTNTYYHMHDMYYNDLSEPFVYFTLN